MQRSPSIQNAISEPYLRVGEGIHRAMNEAAMLWSLFKWNIGASYPCCK